MNPAEYLADRQDYLKQLEASKKTAGSTDTKNAYTREIKKVQAEITQLTKEATMQFDVHKEIAAIIKREGGYVNHPADKGGATNMGITQKTLSAWLGRQATIQDVKKLPAQTAADIYYNMYYAKTKINQLPDLIKPIMFDMTVMSGKRAIKLLQDALTNHDYECGKVDGVIGDKTIKAATTAATIMGNKLIETLTRRRIIMYNSIVAADETQAVFLEGWINRAESFLPKKA
jgi:lysozyme family protein